MKTRTKYIFNWNSLSCFANIWECCKCAGWDFSAQVV